MAKSKRGGAALLLLLGGGALAAVAMSNPASASEGKPKKKQPRRADVKVLARRFSKEFGVPESLILAIIAIESSFVPDSVNMAAKHLGGAWGLGQITVTHASDLTKRYPKVAAKYWPAWDGTGEGLLDLEINVAMTAFTLWVNWERYKKYPDRWLTAGLAHHQGKGNVDKFIKTHKRKDGKVGVNPDQLPPKGKLYWSRLIQKAENDQDVLVALARDQKTFAFT